MDCAICREREASSRYYRLNRLTEEVERLCRPCWLTLRRADRDEWRYFVGVGRFLFLFAVLPFLVLLVLLAGLALFFI